MPSPRYAAVILDLDGTLLHSNAVAPQCVNGTLAEFGLPERPADSLHWCATWPSEPLWTALLPAASGHLVDRCATHYRQLYRDVLLSEGPLFNGAMRVLETLRTVGIKTVILSNRDHDEVQRLASRTGLDSLVSMIAGLSHPERAKPSPAAAAKLAPVFRRVPRNKILMCGDSVVDLLFARNIAVAGCWAKYGYGVHQECENLCPEHTIDSIDELLSTVLEG